MRVEKDRSQVVGEERFLERCPESRFRCGCVEVGESLEGGEADAATLLEREEESELVEERCSKPETHTSAYLHLSHKHLMLSLQFSHPFPLSMTTNDVSLS